MPISAKELNKETYSLPDVVTHYLHQSDLQKPEKVILDLIGPKLKNAKMLDIGVGVGRTTLHFAKLVQEYIGIDYSINMVNECRKRFSNIENNASFELCDVRNMNIFKDSYFDFILFSYNGLDYISHEDRGIALNEIRRIAKNGAIYCFSTHNIFNIEKLFKFDFKRKFNKEIMRYLRLRLLNGNYKNIISKQYTIINDGAIGFKLNTYYINPIDQVKQLRDHGFVDIKIFSLKDGIEISRKIGNEIFYDPWLYYLCEVSK